MVALKEKPTANNLNAGKANAPLAKKSLIAQLAGIAGTAASVAVCLALAVAALEGIFAMAHVGEDTVARPDLRESDRYIQV
jgi:hypothetical protein